MNKEERRALARRHADMTAKAYAKETAASIRGSVVREKIAPKTSGVRTVPEITVEDMTSEDALYGLGSPTVLNFASFVHPGGGFLNGAMAQEEALCHSSNLYDVLSSFTYRYEDNRTRTRSGLYADWGIYSPGIVFDTSRGRKTADVLTVAAPNARRYMESHPAGRDAVRKAMDGRIRFVLDFAYSMGAKELVLGAFGCGVFGNDPDEVAGSFIAHLSSGRYGFEKVVFAVPDGPNGNLAAFRRSIAR